MFASRLTCFRVKHFSATSSVNPTLQYGLFQFREFHKTGITLEHKHNDHDHSKCMGNSDQSVLKEKLKEYIDREVQKDEHVSTESYEHVEILKGSSHNLSDVLASNKKWVKKCLEKNPEYFNELGQKQDPRYLYIGCSDARVDPGRLTGLHHGQMFVHRNVGNVVSSSDLNILSVIDFAVNNLRVPHILVVGHYDCGAVRGSIARPEDGGLGIVENWLRNIRDVARYHKEELLAIEDSELRQRRLVELNVMEQCLNILKVGTVQRRRLKSFITEGFAVPRIHGLVFDPANGLLEKLPLDFGKLISDDREIYDLYQIPDWLKSSGPASPLEDENTRKWT